ncbi:Zn-dependent protease [Streptomyces sp. 2333.5]|uniref:site-2 protease family protein n=1 Tax=Streptomyces TaxID=1883 RepID=UPI0008966424|nr:MULTISPECIES: site-2 protease family protein [unclassified Streptomyces]PJJ03038.1 Zn-dependent protease [Streptomyces sp. 2333.5]SED61382.1 Zn-dependent protease (includes SpoIVFB) [Streptomyces sp. 2314.4]SEE27468.1 Zn-dependent protease (includes SpoIVFB) [Streptomyces sp. 2112.2]SOE12612.1 Zn-dependent protease (includes SpoIVFB) [Streptomyces sp. 2323.1]
MNGSVRVGRVVGVPLRMHWSVPLLVGLFAYGLGRQGLPVWTPGRSDAVYALAGVVGAALLMGSLLLHETAHAAVALRKKISVEDVTLWALGGTTRMGRPQSAAAAFAVAVSGPLTSLVIGGIALGAGFGLHGLSGWAVPSVVLAWLGWANLFLGVFNLLPAVPLDGGRVVQAVLWWRTGDRDRADLAASRGGQIMGLLLVAAGWISVLRGAPGGLWIVFVGLFIMVVAGAERRRAALHTALRGVRVAEAMSSPVTTGADWLTVQRFIDEVAVHSRYSALPLVDFDGRPSGVVQLRRLASVPAASRESLRVREVAIPLSQCAVAAPDEPLSTALDRISLRTGARILVVEDGRLVGIATGKDVSRLMQRSTLSGKDTR